MSADDILIALAPFGQVDSRLARRYEGTGLGLPLTEALLELLGGAMTIKRDRGKGIKITISLPQAGVLQISEQRIPTVAQ